MNDLAQPELTNTVALRKPLSRLILTGFMGAGKSTVGAILARALRWSFFDMDQVIEASSQLTVAQIFLTYGEDDFRERERQAVRQLHQEESIVLALGGGTIEDQSNRSLLIDTPGNCVVFLETDLADLLARCTAEGKIRPLLSAPESFEARHNRRLPYYRSAHITVETTGLPALKVADRILDQISAQWLIAKKAP